MRKQIPPGVFTVVTVFALLTAAILISVLSQDNNVGKPAPGIAGENIITKEPVSLAGLKGKVVLVNFWATWCGPCAMEIPELIQLQKRYANKPFTVLGVSADNEASLAAEYVRQNKMNYPVVMTTPSAANEYGIKAFPTTFVVNKDGKVVFVQEGFAPGIVETFAKEIEKHL